VGDLFGGPQPLGLIVWLHFFLPFDSS